MGASGKKVIRFGLFDSGVGGLSVLRQLHELSSTCPDYLFEFVYLGDTARCPYGNRRPQELKEFAGQIINFLAGHDVDHLVMACNTSASVALDHARQVSPVPVHDLIGPTSKYVAANFRRIGVMATQSTVQSRAFSSRIQYHAPESEVFEIACPKLVPLVEAGQLSGDQVKAALVEYTSQLEAQEVEAIILGCTHFPFLREAISGLLPPTVALIDPAYQLARQLVFDLGLEVSETESFAVSPDSYASHKDIFFTTGNAAAFTKSAQVCLGANGPDLIPQDRVRLLPLEELRDGVVKLTPVSNVVQLPSIKGNDSKIVAP